jgi:hypothetical protein
MDKERKELLETFRRLDPINRVDLLAHIRVAYAAQENTKKQYGIMGPDAPPFNGLAKPGPIYSDRNPHPVMEEAANAPS